MRHPVFFKNMLLFFSHRTLCRAAPLLVLLAVFNSPAHLFPENLEAKKGPVVPENREEGISETDFTGKIKIGVLANRGFEICLKEWGPTAEYLSEALHPLEFLIIPLSFDEIIPAAKDKKVSYIVANPAYYAYLEYHGLAERIATMQEDGTDVTSSVYGGVIFTRPYRNDIFSIPDLKGKKFSAVNRDSLGGWLAASRVMMEHGIDPENDFLPLSFEGTHDNVVLAVLSGKSDAGTVRTRQIEKMAEEGTINLPDIRVIRPENAAENLSFLCSTQLYPEWPFAALTGTDQGLNKKTAIALMMMEINDPAARAVPATGWTTPKDYSAVHDLLRHLGLPPYDLPAEFSLKHVLARYRRYIFSAVLLFLAMAILFAIIYAGNRKLIHAKNKLQESEEKYRKLIDNANEAIFVIDGMKFSFANRKAAEIMSANGPSLEGKNIQEFLPKEAVNEAEKYFYGITETKTGRSTEMRLETAAGHPVWLLVNSVFITWQERPSVLNLAVDITERKRAEEENRRIEAQLFQSRKMESVGRLAGGIAHDFNNMLGVIIGHAELALDSSTDRNDSNYIHFSEILNAANRSADLTRQLLAFARKQYMIPEIIDLNRTVEEYIESLRETAGKEVRLEWVADDEIFPVKADPSQIREILSSLCRNAAGAISGKGLITIRTSPVSVDRHFCEANPGMLPGEYTILSVSDTGCGMDKDTVSKIFEPFFTTSRFGQSAGLGLAMVYGIVKQNNGYIDVQSKPGKGSIFSIYLPAANKNI